MAICDSVLLVISLISVICSTWFAQKYLGRLKVARDQGCQPPPCIVQRDPIFGLDVVFRLFQALTENRRNMSIKQLFETYGNTFKSESWRTSKFYTIEPKNLQAIFSTDFASWGVEPMRLFAFKPFVGKGIMCTDGASWEHSRALLKPTFARTQIADLHLSAYVTHVQRFLELIPRDSSEVDLMPLFSKLALDSSTEFLFGESVGCLSPDTVSTDAQAFLEAYEYGQGIVGKRLHLPQWNFLTRDQRFWISCKTAHDFVDGYIAKGKRLTKDADTEAKESKRYVLAHELLEKTTDTAEVRSQLLNVFLPAHEAAGVALTNIFFNLARAPFVYQKLRQEILTAEAHDTCWTFERLKSLRYLQYVINETFRLNPAIGTNTRMALRDTILPTGGGSSGFGTSPIFVRKGDTITVSFYALHRRQDLFGEDADKFRPERWETLRPPHWAYLTFGGGPRVCPGQNLALTEVAYTVVKILQTFKAIENRDSILDFVELYKITTTSANGAKVSLIPA